MRIAVIGGTEMPFNSAVLLESEAFELGRFVTARSEKVHKRAQSDLEDPATVRGISYLYALVNEKLLGAIERKVV